MVRSVTSVTLVNRFVHFLTLFSKPLIVVRQRKLISDSTTKSKITACTQPKGQQAMMKSTPATTTATVPETGRSTQEALSSVPMEESSLSAPTEEAFATGAPTTDEPIAGMPMADKSETVQKTAATETTTAVNDDEEETFSPEDEAIKKDAADQIVGCIVHFALAFFIVLTGVAAFLAIMLVSQFGFLALFIISLLLVVVFGIAWFLDHVMKEDAKWKPVRREIRRWKAVATAVVLKEVRDFQLDWNEHLLLTDGNAEYDLYDDDELPTMPSSKGATGSAKPKQKRGRSVMFKMVKPFLKFGGRRRRRKQKESEAATEAATDSYLPPVV